MWKLKSYETPLPGQFVYVQRIVGTPKKFGPLPVIEDLARELSATRKANGMARSDLAQCMEDVDCYQCKRLGNMGAYCYNTDGPYTPVVTHMPMLTPCSGCGAKIE